MLKVTLIIRCFYASHAIDKASEAQSGEEVRDGTEFQLSTTGPAENRPSQIWTLIGQSMNQSVPPLLTHWLIGFDRQNFAFTQDAHFSVLPAPLLHGEGKLTLQMDVRWLISNPSCV
jgi:hypothetical protein